MFRSEMLTLARESRGLSQADLAGKIHATQGRLSKIEKGLISVSEGLLSELASCLNYPTSFFYENANIYASGLSLHRKRASLPKRTLDKINAQLCISKFHLVKLLDDIDFPEDAILDMPVSTRNTPSAIARRVRQIWSAERGPLSSLVSFMEKWGILIVPFNFEHRYFDAVSCRIEGLPPLVFINSELPGDRQRFTLAHELGHLVMHRAPSEGMEKEADEFASELLMPESDIFNDLNRLTIPKLWKLKPVWKVSMAALVKRAGTLDILTKNQEQYMWIQLSKAGYRLEEPVELFIQPERATFIDKIIELNLEDMPADDLCRKLCLNDSEFQKIYLHDGEKKKRKKITI